jgi:hypothetical protein
MHHFWGFKGILRNIPSLCVKFADLLFSWQRIYMKVVIRIFKQKDVEAKLIISDPNLPDAQCYRAICTCPKGKG